MTRKHNKMFEVKARAGRWIGPGWRSGPARTRPASALVLTRVADDQHVVTVTFFASDGVEGFYDLLPNGARHLAENLRRHALLADGLPMPADAGDPAGMPGRARVQVRPYGGWVQTYTPWPLPQSPTVLLGGEHALVMTPDHTRELARHIDTCADLADADTAAA